MREQEFSLFFYEIVFVTPWIYILLGAQETFIFPNSFLWETSLDWDAVTTFFWKKERHNRVRVAAGPKKVGKYEISSHLLMFFT